MKHESRPSASFRDYFGLQPNIIVLLAVLLILSAGEEMWSKFAPKSLETLGGLLWKRSPAAPFWVAAAVGVWALVMFRSTTARRP